ncbi:MAG: hypothetical protein M3170_04125 [Candidatus Dormibacteraeota bacterium]|jgi:hypothetical protein|nr:hypothetical protein [Candidatus Dormibacteraeota bacterium]MDQ6920767.1 hypothetical protein [Candidatus Dormibacteraeota bacterium]
MALHAFKRWHREERRSSAQAEADKVRVAVAQLDCADLYLAAAVNLEIEDRDVGWMLDDARRHVLWVRDQLGGPRVVER